MRSDGPDPPDRDPDARAPEVTCPQRPSRVLRADCHLWDAAL
jgi:hypothetical protein